MAKTIRVKSTIGVNMNFYPVASGVVQERQFNMDYKFSCVQQHKTCISASFKTTEGDYADKYEYVSQRKDIDTIEKYHTIEIGFERSGESNVTDIYNEIFKFERKVCGHYEIIKEGLDCEYKFEVPESDFSDVYSLRDILKGHSFECDLNNQSSTQPGQIHEAHNETSEFVEL